MSPALPVLSRNAAGDVTLPLVDQIVRRGLEQARESRRVAIVREDGVFVRRAEPSDAREIHELLERYVAPGMLIPRTLKQVYRSIRDFVVVIDRGEIIGCGALRIYTAELAEVGALAVRGEYRGTGLGKRVVETLVHDARALGLHRVFALTMEERFFHRCGFETTLISEFPEKVAGDCATCARRESCNEIAVHVMLQSERN